MKNLSNSTLMVLAMFILMAFASINTVEYREPIKIDSKPISFEPIILELEVEKLEITTNRHADFLQAIGNKESGNNYSAINTYGYLGKYQFGLSTLRGLGFKVSKHEFLNNPELQEKAMYTLLKHNRKQLKKYIRKYNGKVIHGVYITESGILAAAHIGGAGNVRRFFKKGYDFKDGYGTTLTSYIQKFNSYQLELN